jgi:hypothetical protein
MTMTTENQTTATTPQPTAPQRSKRDRGRPSKRDPATRQRILDTLRAGNTMICAARVGRIDISNLQKWRRADPAFDEAVKDAIGEAETKLVELATAGAKKDGRIALMLLERRYPEGWSKAEPTQQHLHAHAGIASDFLAKLVERRRISDAEALALPVRDAEVV